MIEVDLIVEAAGWEAVPDLQALCERAFAAGAASEKVGSSAAPAGAGAPLRRLHAGGEPGEMLRQRPRRRHAAPDPESVPRASRAR